MVRREGSAACQSQPMVGTVVVVMRLLGVRMVIVVD